MRQLITIALLFAIVALILAVLPAHDRAKCNTGSVAALFQGCDR